MLLCQRGYSGYTQDQGNNPNNWKKTYRKDQKEKNKLNKAMLRLSY